MSVLPFAPGLVPGAVPTATTGPLGQAPGGSGGNAGGTGEVGAEASGAQADELTFPDAGAAFADALSAALLGVPPAPTHEVAPLAREVAPLAREAAGLAPRGGAVGDARLQSLPPEPALSATTSTGSGPASSDGNDASVGTAPQARVGGEPTATALGESRPRGPMPSQPPAPGVVPSQGLSTESSPTTEPAAAEPRHLGEQALPPRGASPAASWVPTGAAVAALGGTAMTGAASAAEQHPVVQQVLPAVVQLATKGNGTHRISVTLQPEHLGEVRVTLVVRDGEVRVSLAADGGTHAKDALLQGAPELRRLLEATGAADARVVVRDLPTTATASTPSTTGSPALADRGLDDRGPGHPGDQPGSGARDREGDGRRQPRAVPQQPIPTVAAPAATPTPGRLDRTV